MKSNDGVMLALINSLLLLDIVTLNCILGHDSGNADVQDMWFSSEIYVWRLLST